ncbi:hypothetical protein BKK51_05925 [Rodentibacter trehalosifermentans]|uniref:Uncharacterized protein n=1 Tax=Rodentibacter trehalosifermentans TaxID=1908263 RepID=A0A1V3IU43_9PAST|nr:hypothetical protein [Rodentibacter trehalosifermentans]OOF45621.1 hypothetical protein BKK51_05925 [Rodentibacter trehalosifermentans]
MEKQQAEKLALHITLTLLKTEPNIVLAGKQKPNYPKEIVNFAKTLAQELERELGDIPTNSVLIQDSH